MEKLERNNKTEKQALARELWFSGDEDEKKLLQSRLLRTTIRAGDRSEGTTDLKRGYSEGGFVTVKIINSKGSFDQWQAEVVVISARTKELGSVEPDDLEGTPLKKKTREELIAKLNLVYGREFTEKDIVTVVRFEYKDELNNVSDLVDANVLSLAEKPQDNVERLDSAYTIPLIEHDYPAKTPAMWNAACREFGVQAANVMMVGDPKNSRHIMDVFRKDANYFGGGAGVGFKGEAMKYLDEIDPLARAIGSINFILKTEKGELKGYNTDGLGYAESLEEITKERGESLSGKKAVILGAGGTGNAVAFALVQKGMEVVILNRTVSKAEELTKRINKYFGVQGGATEVRFGGEDAVFAEVAETYVVVNVSTKGSSGELENYSALAPTKLPATKENIRENLLEADEIMKKIPKGAILSDIVLTKSATPFLATAAKRGFETLDGIPMVINQGVEAFWILYGEELRKKNVTKEKVAKVMHKAACGID